MQQQSNTYIIGFVFVLCIVVGGLLAGANTFLAPAQKKSVELATKSQILGAVRNIVTVTKDAEVLPLYEKRISSLVVDFKGNIVTQDKEKNPVVAEQVDVAKNFKKDPEDKLYPVFRLVSEKDTNQVEAYIIPVYGNGLWDRIWGYVALDSKCETIVGVTFDHKGETPGLGQRIATSEIQERYVSKAVRDDNGKIASVEMTKGEHGGKQASIDYYKGDPHRVDGMSGATLTGNGLNQMMKTYLKAYEAYFDKVRAGKSTAVSMN